VSRPKRLVLDIEYSLPTPTALVLKANLFAFRLLPTGAIGLGQDPNHAGVPTRLEENRVRVFSCPIARIGELAVGPSPWGHLNPPEIRVVVFLYGWESLCRGTG